MDSIQLIYDRGSYNCRNSSSIEMDILGHFFSSDVRLGKESYPTFKDWALNDSLGMGVSGNITVLEKEGDYVYLRDAYSLEEVPTEVKMTRKQFAQLFDEWQEKVCKHKPKEVIIIYTNGQFNIKTTS